MPAPKGNRNALKHGFYARHFTDDEISRFKRKALRDSGLQGEINALRVIADRILERLAKSGLEEGKEGDMNNATIGAINTLVIALASIGTLTRAQQIITGQYQPVEQAIMDALAELNAEEGL